VGLELRLKLRGWGVRERGFICGQMVKKLAFSSKVLLDTKSLKKYFMNKGYKY
jgi:hypothetical protein